VLLKVRPITWPNVNKKDGHAIKDNIANTIERIAKTNQKIMSKEAKDNISTLLHIY